MIFGIHIIIAVVVFNAIAFSAFVLHLLVNWMEAHELEYPIILALRWLTYFIFGMDMLVFIVYLFKETKHFIFGERK